MWKRPLARPGVDVCLPVEDSPPSYSHERRPTPVAPPPKCRSWGDVQQFADLAIGQEFDRQLAVGAGRMECLVPCHCRSQLTQPVIGCLGHNISAEAGQFGIECGSKMLGSVRHRF
jgi:hypothetical protein